MEKGSVEITDGFSVIVRATEKTGDTKRKKQTIRTVLLNMQIETYDPITMFYIFYFYHTTGAACLT